MRKRLLTVRATVQILLDGKFDRLMYGPVLGSGALAKFCLDLGAERQRECHTSDV